MPRIKPAIFRGALAISCAAFFLALPSSAGAFSEDICYDWRDAEKTKLKPQPFNCWDVECRDANTGYNPNRSCASTGLQSYIEAASGRFHTRNMLHYDVVWLLARLLGMRKEDANTLAAYSEAPDQGSYQHYDYLGDTVVSGTTENVNGLYRTNYATYGFWLHYVPWQRLTGMSEQSLSLTFTERNNAGLTPFGAHEAPLNHLRAWAFGQRSDLCEFGILSTPEDPASACINSSGGSRTLTYTVPIVGFTATPAPMTLSWQRVNQQPSPPCDTSSNPAQHETCYQQTWTAAKKGSLLALGAYLHAMDDRLSHFACTDPSAIRRQANGNYSLDYGNGCGQGFHAVLHYEETGHAPTPDRSLNALRFSFLEIDSWLTAMNYPREAVNRASNFPEIKRDNASAIVTLIRPAVERGNAWGRIKALCKTASMGYGVGWHDGNERCQY